MPDVVAILSPGEMGHAIGRTLREHGRRVVTSLRGRSARTAELAAAAGIEDLGSIEALVREADVVMSVLPSAAARPLAEGVAALRPRDLLFVECNALAPEKVQDIDRLLEGAGVRVVDVGIVGSPPSGGRSPRFYASGRDAEALLPLREAGLDVRPIGGEIGQASGLKMCYAALTKGFTALGTELLLAAAKLDLLDPLLEELASSQAAQLQWLERSIPGMPPKSRRWVSEMQEIAATLSAAGQSAAYHTAASDLFAQIGTTALGHERPESRDQTRTMRQVIETLTETSVPSPAGRGQG